MSTYHDYEDCDIPTQACVQPEMLFTSAFRSIRAQGIFAKIDTPAAGGERAGSPLQVAVTSALDRAREAGIFRPIVMGAIPFDTSAPSCLYVPTHYEYVDRTAISGAAQCGTLCPQVLSAHSIPDEALFKQGVRQAIANFQHSAIRKAVLSRLCEIRLAAPLDVASVLANLITQNPSAYHFRLPMADGAELIGASPELLLRKCGEQIQTFPLAGSAKRHSNADEDCLIAAELKRSAKDQHEHRVVVEDLRQVLTPLCRTLSIPETPELVSTATLWHLGTPIQGVLNDPSLWALQLACRVHPTPAVCGFPRGLARKLVDLIEPFERGVFTGIVGWCDDEGNGEWVVTIRCATVDQATLRLFAGVGIVEASCPDAEWDETQAKLGTMLNAFGLGANGALL